MPRFYIFTSRSNVRYQHQPDEVPHPPTSIHTDEDYWRNAVPPVPLNFRWPHPWTFEQNESPTLESALVYDEWQNLVRPVFVWAVPQVFDVNDELHFVPATLSIDDLAWSNPVAPLFSGPVPRVFLDDNVIEIPPPGLAEDYWFNPPRKRMCIIYTFVLRDDDVVIPTPPIRDEDCWINSVAPVAASNYLPLPYLPDPEEIPAGSLAGAIPSAVQGVGMVRVVYGSGEAVVPGVGGKGTITGIKGGGRID